MSTSKNLPVVFTFNILRNVYRQFNTQHFDQLKAIFAKQNINVEFLPIISYERDTVEKRAQSIKSEINKVYEKLNAEQAHVVAYSASGLDFRYFISELGGNQQVKSLTTVGTPHRGSFLAEEFTNGKIGQHLIEPVSRLVGMSSFSFSELNTDNIESFNTSVFNDPNIQYFSIGGERRPQHCTDALKPTGQHIFENKDNNLELNSYQRYKQSKYLEDGIPKDSDGVFCTSEIEWGTHLINFEADHAELVGIGNNIFDVSKLYGLVSDNLKFNFQQQQ